MIAVRDPNTGNSYNARGVYSTGNIYYYYAYNSGGVAPDCEKVRH